MGSITQISIQTTQPTTSYKRLAQIQKDVEEAVSHVSGDLREVIRKIFDNPELAFEEYIAHDSICDFLEHQGFKVTRQAYGVDTAFEALSGEGGRLISINAEYDALPEVGHGCGHHLIAACSIAAFLGLHFAMKKHGIKGRLQLLGTPAEENGGGKVRLLDGGAYEGVDAAVMSHPNSLGSMHSKDLNDTGLAGSPFLALKSWFFEFFGRASHASAAPEDGINAFDAAVAAYNNVALLRQQILNEERVHGCLLEGPRVPNTIGQYTKLRYQARSLTAASTEILAKRVVNCFEGAAIATGCTLKITESVMYADVVLNQKMCQRYADIANSIGGQQVKVMSQKTTCGSSDFGNVTYKCPGLHTFFAVDCHPETGVHQQVFTDACGTEDAFVKAMHTATLVALTAWDLLTDDEFFEDVKKEWKEDLEKRF